MNTEEHQDLSDWSSLDDSDIDDLLHDDDECETALVLLAVKEHEDRVKLLDRRRGSVMGRTYIQRNRFLGHATLMEDYFAEVLAQQYGSDLLQGELERTRLNIACFMEPTLQSASAPAGSKPSSYSSYQASAPHHQPVQVSSPSFRRQQTSTNSPVVSRRRR